MPPKPGPASKANENTQAKVAEAARGKPDKTWDAVAEGVHASLEPGQKSKFTVAQIAKLIASTRHQDPTIKTQERKKVLHEGLQQLLAVELAKPVVAQMMPAKFVQHCKERYPGASAEYGDDKLHEWYNSAKVAKKRKAKEPAPERRTMFEEAELKAIEAAAAATGKPRRREAAEEIYAQFPDMKDRGITTTQVQNAIANLRRRAKEIIQARMEPGQQPEASSSGVYSSQGSTHTQNSYSGDACTLHTFLHDEERLISMELSKLASPTATVHPLSSLTQLQVDTAYVDIKPLVEKLAKDRRITNHCSGEATYHYTMEHFKEDLALWQTRRGLQDTRLHQTQITHQHPNLGSATYQGDRKEILHVLDQASQIRHDRYKTTIRQIPLQTPNHEAVAQSVNGYAHIRQVYTHSSETSPAHQYTAEHSQIDYHIWLWIRGQREWLKKELLDARSSQTDYAGLAAQIRQHGLSAGQTYFWAREPWTNQAIGHFTAEDVQHFDSKLRPQAAALQHFTERSRGKQPVQQQ